MRCRPLPPLAFRPRIRPAYGNVCATARRQRHGLQRTVPGLAFRTRHAGGRGQRMRQAGDSRAHPRHAARVRRYGIRQLDITSSIPHPRASAQRRACKVSGLPLSHAAAPPPFPPAGTAARDTRASASPHPLKAKRMRAERTWIFQPVSRRRAKPVKKPVRIAPHAGAACGSFRLENRSGGILSLSEAGAIPVRPPAVFHTLAALSYTP